MVLPGARSRREPAAARPCLNSAARPAPHGGRAGTRGSPPNRSAEKGEAVPRAQPPPFPAWLAARLDALGLDRAVYGAYIEGLLREEESDEERLEALRAVLAACLEEDLLNDVCREVVERWSDSQVVDAKEEKEDEVQAITSMMEKQARIVVKPKEVSQEEKQRKAALLAQYANVTDEEDGGDEQDGSTTAVNIGSEKSLFRNTNVEDVLNARKLERELLRDEFQKKKEQDKLQREKDKLAKQERKEKEKKRTQKGERKR
ncbi:PREDICTED: coiled-coil domain-containing protein 43 [Pseudopodoces humilis]|uniref:coiled-coil domain-containing protein 43 n=1 Tax=Pseudopodoces humilis TaxID=181119 RepID=UPI0006B7035B|nr:PREDICTED: coiled-coil domain-containing protein 43 [Pseudopodoces humilis]